MLHDYHTHTNYSDGTIMYRMLRAAEEAGLDGIGFADHCNVSDRAEMRKQTADKGFNLDMTYERRRAALQRMRDRFDIRIFDAVEIDYHPADQAAIEEFFTSAGFDYTVGSVHYIDGVNVHNVGAFKQRSQEEREAAVDRYFEMVTQMVVDEVVDIAAHIDVIERNAALRGIADESHYRRLVDALARSSTVPEINAGRLLGDYGAVHPAPRFMDVLLERDIRFTFGTDSHTPGQVRDRVPALLDVFDEHGLEPLVLDNEAVRSR